MITEDPLWECPVCGRRAQTPKGQRDACFGNGKSFCSGTMKFRSISGLSVVSLRQYRYSSLLERTEDGRALYMHRRACPNYCDWACNGRHGERIAADIDALEKRPRVTEGREVAGS